MTDAPLFKSLAAAQRSFMRLFVLAALPALLLSCMPEPSVEELPFEPSGPEAAPSPAELGPFKVGVRTITLQDTTREAPGGGEPRTLVTEVWYPASNTVEGEPTVDYDLWANLPEDLQETIPEDALGVLQTPAVQDAPPQLEHGTFPLVMFSHGKGGIRMQSTFYTVALASHGYIVISPDHQGDTLVELVREGDVEISSTTESFLDRPLDIHFLVDHFQNLPEDDPLAPIVDGEHIGMTGHSFGALTSFRVAGESSHIDAVVAQTPVGIGLVNLGLEVPVEDFIIPTQIQAAGEDRTLEKELHADSLWEYMPAPAYYLNLATGGHFTYSDLCIFDIEAINEALPDIDVSKVLEDGCGPEQMRPEVAFPVINHFAIGFFNVHLRGSTPTEAKLSDQRANELAPNDATLQIKR
jgi:predicted dienelactone hydrolase